MFIPDPDLDFLPIPDPGVKKSSDPGSGSAQLLGGGFITSITVSSSPQMRKNKIAKTTRAQFKFKSEAVLSN
jgi:hypothetical protein